MDKALERTADLAKALGADMNAKAAVDGKARFEPRPPRSAKPPRPTRHQGPGGSGSADLFYASSPDTSADLKYFKSLGVEFITPDKLDESGFFESLSWENAGKYKADLVLLDNRTGTLQPEELKAKATWPRCPR